MAQNEVYIENFDVSKCRCNMACIAIRNLLKKIEWAQEKGKSQIEIMPIQYGINFFPTNEDYDNIESGKSHAAEDENYGSYAKKKSSSSGTNVIRVFRIKKLVARLNNEFKTMVYKKNGLFWIGQYIFHIGFNIEHIEIQNLGKYPNQIENKPTAYRIVLILNLNT